MNSEDEHATTNGGAVHVSTEILLWCDSNCNSDVKKMDAYTMLFKTSLEDIHVGDFETMLLQNSRILCQLGKTAFQHRHSWMAVDFLFFRDHQPSLERMDFSR